MHMHLQHIGLQATSLSMSLLNSACTQFGAGQSGQVPNVHVFHPSSNYVWQNRLVLKTHSSLTPASTSVWKGLAA